MDYNAYVDFCRAYSENSRFDFAVIPYMIGGDIDEPDELVVRWPDEIKGAPVLHLNDEWDWLAVLQEYLPDVLYPVCSVFGHEYP